MIWGRVLSLLIGYAFGNILPGYLLAKHENVDLTKVGSGNVGSTNTMRALGPKKGFLTLALDSLKCITAVFITWLIFRFGFNVNPHIYMTYAGLGAVIGHDFPIALKFKGGKGIASTLGFAIALFPLGVPVAAVVFLLIVAITRYVSLGSIIAVPLLCVQGIIFTALDMMAYEPSEKIEVYVICAIVSILAVALHHANIGRLIHHNERKLSFHPETRE